MAARDKMSPTRKTKTRNRVHETERGGKSAGKARGAELVWSGKNDEYGRAVENSRNPVSLRVLEIAGGSGIEDGWRNKLILGDNRVAATSLLDDFSGKVDFIYIDPPFATGGDFNFLQKVGGVPDEAATGPSFGKRSPRFFEWRAYSDTWKRGIGSYLSMLAELVVMMRDLLDSRGSLMIHVDYRLNAHVRLLLDEYFGPECFMNEIIWHYQSGGISKRFYPRKHDSIIWYGRTPQPYFDPEAAGEPRNKCPACGCIRERWNNLKKHVDSHGRIYRTIKSGNRIYKYYDDETVTVPDVWLGINHIQQKDPERTGYPTQKPERLLQRIVQAHCPPGGLVADLFCGSGTTLIAAEKLGRRWIGCDSSRFAIHTTRKRLLDLGVSDNSGAREDPEWRPFEMLEPGGYESGSKSSGAEQADHIRFVLESYKAEPIRGGVHVHGKKKSAVVHVAAFDEPVGIGPVEQALKETAEMSTYELHVLGRKWESGLYDFYAQRILAEPKGAKPSEGVRLRLYNIPAEAMEMGGADECDIRFFGPAALEVELKAVGRGARKRLKAVLRNLVIPDLDRIPEDIRSRILKWSDFIDYWAVDWDYSGSFFVNRWRSFRTPRKRSLAIETPIHTYDSSRTFKVFIKVVDILGNETGRVLAWKAG